jgi:kynurenine formamidase
LKPRSITYSNIISLSHKICPGIPKWPNDPDVVEEIFSDIDADGYYLKTWTLGEHAATHMNAPRAFYDGGITIEDYPATSLVNNAVVIDVRTRVKTDADYLLSVEDLESWEETFGPISERSIVLLHTGWSKRWEKPLEYNNIQEDGSMHFPGFDEGAARFMLEERKVSGIGIDTHGVDGGYNAVYPVNKLMLKGPNIVLENLTNLDLLPASGITLFVGPIKLCEGSGSPVEAIALF